MTLSEALDKYSKEDLAKLMFKIGVSHAMINRDKLTEIHKYCVTGLDAEAEFTAECVQWFDDHLLELLVLIDHEN